MHADAPLPGPNVQSRHFFVPTIILSLLRTSNVRSRVRVHEQHYLQYWLISSRIDSNPTLGHTCTAYGLLNATYLDANLRWRVFLVRRDHHTPECLL